MKLQKHSNWVELLTVRLKNCQFKCFKQQAFISSLTCDNMFMYNEKIGSTLILGYFSKWPWLLL